MNVRNLLQNNSIGERSNWVAEVIVNNEYLSDLLSSKANSADLATVATSGSYTDLTNKPTKLSDFTNDSGFITNTVNNLTNYYLSSNTYTKTEVNNLIASIVTLNIVVVQTLPVSDISTHTIYLVPKTTAGTDNVYDEYINTDGTSAGWELIGSTEVDLSNYYTKTEIDLKVADLQASILRVDGDIDSIELDIADLQASVLRVEGEIPTYTEGDGIDISASDVISVDTTFTDTSTRTNIASGDSFSTILGKIKKFFADLKSVAFSGSYTDLSDKPTIPTNNNQLTNGAGYITSSGSCAYATSAGSATDSTKVDKAGDTMTGALTINQSTSTPLTLKRTNTSFLYIRFQNNNGTLGYFGVNTGNKAIFSNSSGTDSYITYRKTNWTSYDSDAWRYWQDDDGYYHFYYYKDITLNFSTNYKGGVIYIPADVWYVSYPKTISGLKGCQVTTKYSSDIMGASIHSISTTKLGIWFWRCNSGSITFGVNISLVGW